MLERTFAYITPIAVKNKSIGKILSHIENQGFIIIHSHLLQFTKSAATTFYTDQQEKEFFENLIHETISDKILALVLEKENAIDELKTFIDESLEDNIPLSKLLYSSASTEKAVQEITYVFGRFAAIPSDQKDTAKHF